MSHHPHLLALARSAALTFQGLIRPHAFHVGWVWLHISLCGCVLCMVLVHLQPVVIVIVCHAIATNGGVGDVLHHGLCLDRSVALTLEGLIRPHSMVVGSGCIYPSVVESVAWVLYISSPWALFAMPLQPMEEWVVFLIMGSVLPGYMFRYQYCYVGGLEAIVFGSIRWCFWSFRPSSPLRLPHLKCLLLLLLLLLNAIVSRCKYGLARCNWQAGLDVPFVMS